jgi:hypothetical protein
MIDISASNTRINTTENLSTFRRDVLCLSAGSNSRAEFVCYLLPCITHQDPEDEFSTFIRNVGEVLYPNIQHIPEYRTITLQKTVWESNSGKKMKCITDLIMYFQNTVGYLTVKA